MPSDLKDALESLILEREYMTEKGVFGRLLQYGMPIAQTCELPWRNNEQRVSCIPKGYYKVVRRTSPKYGEHFHILDVPNRQLILIHHGNFPRDVKGCVAVGAARGELSGEAAVLDSKNTMRKLIATLPKSFYLQVTGVCG